MLRKRIVLWAALALILILAAALPVFAQDNGPGKLIIGGDYTLESGQRLLGDLVVLGGIATLQEDSLVFGSVLVTGGTLRISGEVEGDVAVLGGFVELTSTARVSGELTSVGGTVRRAEGAIVSGGVKEGFEFGFPGGGRGPVIPETPLAPDFVQPPGAQSPGQWLLGLFLRLLRAVGVTLALGALALILAALWPKGVELVGKTALDEPVLAFAVGLLTWVLAVALGVIMTITICLIPLALVLFLALLAAALLAWVAAGWVVGRKLLSLLNLGQATVPVEAAVGTLLVTLLYHLLGFIACVGFLFALFILSLGLGAVTLTRFGLQPYAPAGRRVAEPTALLVEPEPAAAETAIAVEESTAASAEPAADPAEADDAAEPPASEDEENREGEA